MKPYQFILFEKLLTEVKPLSIAEIGVHKGRTASQLCEFCLKTFNNSIHYTGYDAFELLSDHKSELNGKGPANKLTAIRWLEKMKKRYPNRLSYTLIEGWTSNTLIEPVAYDFVYIDGGHSYESVLHDWNMLKKSKIVVFDDYHMPGVSKVLKENVEPFYSVEYTENTDVSRASAIVRNYK